MITPSDKKKIEEFNQLTTNHKRVFKHRLIKKCLNAQEDLLFVLRQFNKLNLKIDKIILPQKIFEILEIYENLCKLQNM